MRARSAAAINSNTVEKNAGMLFSRSRLIIARPKTCSRWSASLYSCIPRLTATSMAAARLSSQVMAQGSIETLLAGRAIGCAAIDVIPCRLVSTNGAATYLRSIPGVPDGTGH